MSTVSGIIQQIKTKKVGAQQKTAYDLQVNGQWFGYGFFAPKASEGDYVTFTGVQNGNFWNVERNSLKVGKAPPQEKTQTVVKQAVNSFDSRQDAISRQAASNTAISWLTFLAAQGALPTTAKNKGDLQSRLDIMRREYEKEFFEANTGNEWKDISPNKKYEEDVEVDSEEESGSNEPWE